MACNFMGLTVYRLRLCQMVLFDADDEVRELGPGILGRCGIRFRHSSGRTGSTIMSTADGSSRSLRYNSVPFGRGTLKLESIKPAGTGTVWLNSASEATESIRNKFAPLSLHCWSGLSGQRISFSVGTRTRLTRGIQSPLLPSESTGWKRNGPNAEGPKFFAGSKMARAVFESCRMRLPSASLSNT